MDEYQDNEVFPEGGSAADTEAVKARVMEQARMSAPAKKKMPRRKKLFLAAALAAVMVVLVGAGFPSIVYQLTSGTLSFEETAEGRITTMTSTGPLIEAEEGRLFSLLDGGREDITDRIDADTPYIVDCSDPDNGLTYYIVMGGTPEWFGSFEWIVTPDPFAGAEEEEGVKHAYSYDAYRQGADGGNYSSSRLGFDRVVWKEWEKVPVWLLSAMDELEIPYEYHSPGDTVTVDAAEKQ